MPIIGIITREDISEENHKINITYNDIIKSIINNGGIPISITLTKNYKHILNLCDGIIFQGGDETEKYDLEALEYLYNINKPVLGICLGMQEMGLLFDGNLMDINNHKKNLSYAHEINILENSKLHQIFNTNKLKVNSRHKSVLKNTKLKITSISHDGYVESIEDSNKKFFIGVQWHPESMIEYSNIQNNLFKCFIESCK